MKKKPPSLCSFLLYRKNRREAQPSHRYLFQSSVFDVELFCIDEIEQLPILLPVRGNKHRRQLVRTNSGGRNHQLIPTGQVGLKLVTTPPKTSVRGDTALESHGTEKAGGRRAHSPSRPRAGHCAKGGFYLFYWSAFHPLQGYED